ncbi:hypothetical protein D3C85_1249200 [compost metagenome]
MDQGVEDLAFARRQTGHAALDRDAGALGLVQVGQTGQAAAHRLNQARRIEGLFDEVDDAGLHHLHHHGHVGMAGDDDDGPGGAAQLANAAHHVGAVHVGHAHVGDDTGRGVFGQGVKEVPAAGEAARADADASQQNEQGIANRCVVVDNEYGVETHGCSPTVSRIRLNEKAAPPNALFATTSRPPWLSTMVRVTDRPRPMPPDLVEVIGWNMRST